MKKTYLHVLFLILLCFSLNVYSQDLILTGGELSGNHYWQGTVRIQGDVLIPKNSQLTIAPGTQVLFEPNGDKTKGGTDKTRSELIIRGSIIARGQPDSKIIFTSAANAPRMADWYGIQILHTKSENFVDYCTINYAYNGITIKNTNLQISNSEIRYNYNAGIRTEVKSKPTLIKNIISENGYAGVICELGSAPVLTENLISGNPMGIVIMSLSQPNIGSLDQGDNYNPGKNQFSGNEDFDIYNHSNKSILAQNNTWESQDNREISQKIYDNRNNTKYGTIEFEPVFNSRARQSTLSRFMIVAQETTIPPANNPVGASETINTDISNLAQAETAAPLQDDIIQEIDSTMEETLSNQNQTSPLPILATNNQRDPGISETEKQSVNPVEQIDYNRVFLEPFLDDGRKKILYKESIDINTALKNLIEPGEIRIRVVVNQQGLVESADVLRGINEVLDLAIVDAIKKYRYDIGTINGIPVRFSTNEVVRFQ